MRKVRASMRATLMPLLRSTVAPSRVSSRSVQSMLAAFMAREKPTSTEATAVLRSAGTTGWRLTITGAVAPMAQATEALLVPALPARSATPWASTVSW